MIFKRKKTGIYTGPLGFADGFHYPVASDGGLDRRQPIVVEMRDGEEVFVWGTKASPTHQHVYEKRQVDIEPFTED